MTIGPASEDSNARAGSLGTGSDRCCHATSDAISMWYALSWFTTHLSSPFFRQADCGPAHAVKEEVDGNTEPDEPPPGIRPPQPHTNPQDQGDNTGHGGPAPVGGGCAQGPPEPNE